MRKAQRVLLDDWGRAELARLRDGDGVPVELRRRAEIIAMSAGGARDEEVAARLGMSTKTVSRWRRRYLRDGLAGLRETVERPAPRRAIAGEKVEEIVRRTLQELPARGGAWSSRAMAAVTGVSEASVRRIWRERGIRPGTGRPRRGGGTVVDWEFHGLYMEPGTRVLALRRERGEGPAEPPANGEEHRGSRAALLLRLLVARSVGVGRGSGEEGQRRFLRGAMAGMENSDVLFAVEAVTPEAAGRLRVLAQREFPAARVMAVASHVEWVGLLEASVARLESSAEGQTAEILADFGGRIHRYLEEPEATFDWTNGAERKAASAHTS